MGFYERLTGEQSPRIPQHAIQAYLGEVARGQLTLAQVATYLNLTAEEQAEALALFNKIVYPRECVTFGGQVTLSNVGTAYDSTTASQGLGTAIIQTAGITQIIFGVRVNKVGSGTQSWQLWNETDGTEVAVIDDADAAGVKNLSITRDFTQPLAAGIKTIRVRAKSTTANDDPVYMGACASIRRAAILTPVELHEVTLLMTQGYPYYPASALRARLSV